MKSKSEPRVSRERGKIDHVSRSSRGYSESPEGLQFLHEHVEGLGNTGIRQVLALHDGLVDLGASRDVVGLHGEDLLEGVRGAVGLQRPDLHLPEPLPTELGLSGQGLLGDQGVGSDAPGVDLVVHQVGQLQHVHLPHRDREVEAPAAPAVPEPDLPVGPDLGRRQDLQHRGVEPLLHRLLPLQGRSGGEGLLRGRHPRAGPAPSRPGHEGTGIRSRASVTSFGRSTVR
jgi:hypothetical protein